MSRAFSITRRCLEIAWRVSLEPAARVAIEAGPPTQSFDTKRRRVSSPKAAKSRAEVFAALGFDLLGMAQVFLDQLNLQSPTALVRRKSGGSSLDRNTVEAGFGDRQQDAIRRVLEFEDDERRWFG
jgi:hypothetical protein